MKKEYKDIKILSYWLDNRFQGPFGLRFGLDALIGLIPGAGDIITTALSLYIVIRAFILGVRGITLLKMIFNILVENIIDLIPFVGNLFDFYWQANLKNLELLEEYLRESTQSDSSLEN